MADLEIVGLPQSVYVRVVRMACEEKGVPYKLRPVVPRSADAMELHPFGKIPSMRHGDVTLFESKAITTYIDRMFGGPRLIPDDTVSAATVEQWISACTTTILPAMSRYVQCYFFPKGPGGQPDRDAIEAALPGVLQSLTVLDRAVAATGYLAGRQFTLADLYPLPVLAYLRALPEGCAAVEREKNLNSYFETHSQRASFRNTVPPPLQDLERVRAAIS
jgi:glutathione S-transferase